MKIITSIKNIKKEEFCKDFILRVFYSFMLGCTIDETEGIKRAIQNIGFEEIDDSLYFNKKRDAYIVLNEKMLSICFEHFKERSSDRLELVNEVFSLFVNTTHLKVTALSIMHLNRYVLSNFADSEIERKRALSFFFTNEFATEEEIIYRQDNIISHSKVSFSKEDSNLDFTITACALLDTSNNMNVKDQFTSLDEMSYKYWRTAVSKNVIEEMRRKEDE